MKHQAIIQLWLKFGLNFSKKIITKIFSIQTDSSNVTAQHVANHTSTQPAENVMPSPHLQRRITDWLCGTASVKRPNDSDKGSPVAKKRMRRSSQPSCSKNAIDTVDVENEPTGAKVVAYADKQKSLNKIPQNVNIIQFNLTEIFSVKKYFLILA